MSNIRRQSIISSLVIYVGFAIGLINVYFFTKQNLFTEAQYGLTTVFIAIARMMSIFSNLAMPSYIYKFYPYYKDHLPDRKNDMLSWALLAGVVGFAVVMIAGWLLKDLVLQKYGTNSPLLVVYYYWIMNGQHLEVDMPHILSILSLIFRALVIIVSIKYIIFTMRADNKGEGGSLALMALANRFSKKRVGSVMLIPILGIFAAALFYGDSVITPAISVLSAIEGLQVAAPALSHWVTPITLTIIAVLFAFQKLGTDSVGKLFGPIMCIWFATLAVLGLYNILENPSVLMAINPIYAIEFAIESPLITFLTLGGVVLVLTGSEALYADMGHFGELPIQLCICW